MCMKLPTIKKLLVFVKINLENFEQKIFEGATKSFLSIIEYKFGLKKMLLGF